MSTSSSSSSWPAFPASWAARRTAKMLVRSPDALPGARLEAPTGAQLDDRLAARQPHQLRDEPHLPPTRRRRAVNPPRAARHLSLSAFAALALVAAISLLAAISLRHLRDDPAPAQRSAHAVLAGVAQRYAATAHLSADLRITTTNFAFDSTAVRRGHLFLARGGKLRWDALAEGDPPHLLRSLISDGSSLTLLDFALRERVKLHRPDDPLVVATSVLLSPTLAADYTAALAPLERYLDDDRDDRGVILEPDPRAPRYALALTPRSTTTVNAARAQRLVLLVDASLAVRHIVLESAYHRTRFSFSDEDTATPPAPNAFLVDPSDPALTGFRFVDAEL